MAQPAEDLEEGDTHASSSPGGMGFPRCIEPDPDIAQHEGQADVEESYDRIAGRGAYASLFQLSVAGLDAKATTIEFPDLVVAAAYLPARKEHDLAASCFLAWMGHDLPCHTNRVVHLRSAM